MEVNKYLKNLTCLYVEDEDFIRDSFSLMLKRYFKELFIAKNGKEGLEIYKEKRPDIIISDIRMPEMDGIEMAKKIKEINPKAYIIFITAFSDIEYLKEAIEIGVEGYITKPIDRKILLKKLNFIADIIKNEREKEELFKILKAVFDSQIEATILLENETPKICNKKFIEEFKDCNFFNELKKFIDLNNTLTQTIEINNHTKRIFEVKIKKIDEIFTIVYLYNITNFENEIFNDELTKVYNRKYLNKILEKKLNKKLCIIICDIDHFKQINDNFGHPKGDEILKNFSNLLKNNLRKSDLVIRIGGEEFLIILDGVENIDIAVKVAEFLREKVEQYDFNGIKITSSFGVCCKYIQTYEDFAKLYQLTDKALYNAKKEGRNRVKVCE